MTRIPDATSTEDDAAYDAFELAMDFLGVAIDAFRATRETWLRIDLDEATRSVIESLVYAGDLRFARVAGQTFIALAGDAADYANDHQQI